MRPAYDWLPRISSPSARKATLTGSVPVTARIACRTERLMAPQRSVADRSYVVHVVIDERQRSAGVVVGPDPGKRLGLDHFDLGTAQSPVTPCDELCTLSHTGTVHAH